jgi:Lrp/AsnC family leucine-responsive transcriptional regulator
MDALDRRLLREVQQDCTRSAALLADLCHATESTVLRRLRRLRETGAIRAEVAVVDPAQVGRGLQLWVRVRLEREGGAGARAFVARVSAHPDVVQFFFVTGTSDYLIMLCVGTMEQYDQFVQENLVADPLVVLSDTNVVIRPIKWSLAVPIDDPAG